MLLSLSFLHTQHTPSLPLFVPSSLPLPTPPSLTSSPSALPLSRTNLIAGSMVRAEGDFVWREFVQALQQQVLAEPHLGGE